MMVGLDRAHGQYGPEDEESHPHQNRPALMVDEHVLQPILILTKPPASLGRYLVGGPR